MFEQPCNAVFSILVNVIKGLKLPALAESSSISAQTRLGDMCNMEVIAFPGNSILVPPSYRACCGRTLRR